MLWDHQPWRCSKFDKARPQVGWSSWTCLQQGLEETLPEVLSNLHRSVSLWFLWSRWIRVLSCVLASSDISGKNVDTLQLWNNLISYSGLAVTLASSCILPLGKIFSTRPLWKEEEKIGEKKGKVWWSSGKQMYTVYKYYTLMFCISAVTSIILCCKHFSWVYVKCKIFSRQWRSESWRKLAKELINFHTNRFPPSEVFHGVLVAPCLRNPWVTGQHIPTLASTLNLGGKAQ